MSALGAVLGTRSTHLINQGLADLGISTAGTSSSQIPNVRALPAPVAHVIESAYGNAVGLVFGLAVPLLIISAIAILAIREVPLRSGPTGSPEPEVIESRATDRTHRQPRRAHQPKHALASAASPAGD